MGNQCFSPAETDARSTGTPAAVKADSSAGPKAAPLSQEGSVMDTTSSAELGAKPGSQPILMAEVRYGIVFGEMNEVFNGRVNRILTFLWTIAAALSGGSLLALLGKVDQSMVLFWTLGLAVISALALSAQKAFKFHEREGKFHSAKKAFQDLEGKGWSMNQGTLNRELAKLRANAPSGGTWLASLAYNRACNELGHPDFQIDVPPKVRWVASLAT